MADITNATVEKMGENVRKARLRQRITMNELAETAGISRTTMINIENGHAGVSIGAWTSVLRVLGMLDSFASSVDAKNDLVGLEMMDRDLPQRVRAPRSGRKIIRKF